MNDQIADGAEGPNGSNTVRYLDDEWLRRADIALGPLNPISASVSVGINVTAGPDGDRAYRLILGPDRVGVAPGLAGSGVHMNLEWTVAVAIATGKISAQRAFLDGKMQLGGDASLLLGHQAELAEIDDRLAELRAATSFE